MREEENDNELAPIMIKSHAFQPGQIIDTGKKKYIGFGTILKIGCLT